MKNKFQSNLDGQMLDGGSIEHPLSIHSASIGTRWKQGGWQVLMTLAFLFTFATGQMWADLTAHIPGVYEKATNKGGYGCTLTTVASGENAGTFEVYYFSAQSKYSENTTVYNEGTKQQYRLMCADGDSEYQLINRNGTGTFTASCDWIEMAYGATGFSKSDYTFGSNKFNEFFEITPNGGNTGITKTCYIKPKQGDVLTLKVSGYVEFAILGSDNGSSKYMTISVDGGTPTSWKSNTLSRRSVTLTTGEHTIVVANVGTSANNFYGFSLKLPSCDATVPGNISKGTLSAGVLTLNAAGSAASGDTWYWQTAEDGVAKTNSGSSYNVSAAGTYYIRSYNTSDDCWSGAKSITVTATDLVSNYTVKYMDGTTELGSEAVEVGEHPTGIADPEKDCYAFAGWSPALNTISGTDGQVINVSATWTARYALSFNFGTTTDLTKDNIASKLDAKNIACSVGTGGSYDSGGTTGYLGYKFKNNGDYITFLVQEGYEAIVTYGYTESGWTVNGASAGVATKTKAYVDKKYQAPTGDGDKLYKLVNQSADSKTSVLTNIVIQEIPAVSNDATLSDLKVGGTTVDGFAANKLDYYVELPYGSTSQPTVTATKHDTKAEAVITQTIASLDNATVTVTAEDGTTINTYTVHFILGPKFGVELIKVATTGGTNKTVTGLYVGDGDVNLSNSTKMDDGKYIGFTLDGTTLQAGDQINVHTTTAANSGGSHVIFYDNMTDKNELYETGEIGGKGNNMFTINAAMVDHATAYVYRSNADAAHKWNGYVDNIAVYRLMAPFIESFEIAGIGALTINGTNITAEVSQDFDVTALTPTIKYWGNGGGAIDKTGAQDFTSPVTYTVSSAYAEDNTGAYAPVTYTVTITKVVPSATPNITTQPQGANYDEGASIAALSVEASAADGGTLTYQWYLGAAAIEGATAATYQPTVSEIGSYSYTCVVTNKKDDKPAASVTSNAAVIVIAEDPAAIKLLNGSTVNTTNFITGVSAEKITISEVEYDCVKFSGTVSSVTGVKDLTRVIAYNATTSATRIKLSLYNNSTSSRTVQVKGLVEGATEAVDLAAIELGNKEKKVSDWIEFNNAANRTIYIFIGSSAGDVRFLQVKVVESGDALKMAGEAGYSLNFNQGRFFGVKDKTAKFEGLNVAVASSDCQPLSTSVVKLNSTSMSFTVVNPILLKVTTANNKTYYVANSASGTTNETAKTGVSEFNLAAGTWYINAGTSDVQISKIAFELPKAAKPTIETQPATNQTFGPGNLTATVVATVSDGGTLKYQWYDASNDEEVEGATSATLTTTTEGTYYVIVTNTLADHSDNSVKSESATLGYRVMDDATLSALSASEGTLNPAFDKDVLDYRVDLPEGTVDVPTLSATATMDGYATVNITDATAFVDYEATSTVVVTSEDGTESKTYTVKFYVDHMLPQVDVTESTTWDWTYAAEGTVTIKVTASTEPIKKNEEGLMANVRVDDNKPTNDATFNSQALLFYGENVRAKDGGRWYASLGHIKFNVTKPGIVEVEFSDNGSNNRCLSINGFMSPASSSKTDVKTFKVFVPAGEVTLMGMEGAAPDKYIRISKITYTVKETPDYSRDVTNNIGTLCVDHNVLVGGAMGATFYQIASRNEQYNDKIDFEEVLPNEELKAGEPYIFQSTTGRIDLFYADGDAVTEPVVVRGMHGVLADGSSLTITEENKMDVYYIQDNKLRDCSNLSSLTLVANRAYIVMSEVPTYEQYTATPSAGAPRRRVTLGKNTEQVATGLENLNASDKPMKLMINGQIFILRGEKMFNVNGQLVK